tara:strand:- start:599 stop:1981 length:1383 start_codon:yes stop_codon:yes gene_type:complete
MNYNSTRNSGLSKPFDEIIIDGLSSDGGLYMPTRWPEISINDILKNKSMQFEDIVYQTIQPFIGNTIDEKDLKKIIVKSYKVFQDDVAPLINLSENKYILELFHGPTFAFKDYPLQLLGNLFQYYLSKKKKNITVIGATSGDTGSAAIHACKDKDNINIFILHPEGKVSDIQRKQMTTIHSRNVKNIAVKGNFDDCQSIVKKLFNSSKLNKITDISAVNSINWARIISQSAYFIWAYYKLKMSFDKVNFIVPTGNFGNVYAAHVASNLGLPINKLYIATNANDIMYRTIENGDMKLKSVIKTHSPSMDIQVSSNFERQLFETFNYDSDRLNAVIKDFNIHKECKLDNDTLKKLKNIYKAKSVDDSEIINTISSIYSKYKYIADPHTATGLNILEDISNNDANISLACAHPAKFPEAIKKSLNIEANKPEGILSILNKEEKYVSLENDLNAVEDYIISEIK